MVNTKILETVLFWQIKNFKLSSDSTFSFFSVYSFQNENVESTGFLEKVILGEEKVARATSFAKSWLWSHLILKNLSKYEEKELSLSVENPLQEYIKSIFDDYKWYITHMAQLIMIMNYIPQHARDVFKTSFLGLLLRL